MHGGTGFDLNWTAGEFVCGGSGGGAGNYSGGVGLGAHAADSEAHPEYDWLWQGVVHLVRHSRGAGDCHWAVFKIRGLLRWRLH